MQELTETARELQKYGLITKEELSQLISLSVNAPVNEAELMAMIAEKYPRGDQSISLEEVLSPERLAESREGRKSRFSIGGTPLKSATAAASREVMQHDFDAGKCEVPDE
jgi:hypothetical protein